MADSTLIGDLVLVVVIPRALDPLVKQAVSHALLPPADHQGGITPGTTNCNSHRQPAHILLRLEQPGVPKEQEGKKFTKKRHKNQKVPTGF